MSTGQQPAQLLAKHQPCGCIVCTCEDDLRCHGCGAWHCGTHPVSEIPNAVYEQPARPGSGEELVERLLAGELCPQHGQIIESECVACELVKALRALAAAQQRIAAMREAFAMIRRFAQDGIENGHDRAQIGNQYAIRDLCDDFLKEPT